MLFLTLLSIREITTVLSPTTHRSLPGKAFLRANFDRDQLWAHRITCLADQCFGERDTNGRSSLSSFPPYFLARTPLPPAPAFIIPGELGDGLNRRLDLTWRRPVPCRSLKDGDNHWEQTCLFVPRDPGPGRRPPERDARSGRGSFPAPLTSSSS